ncbi:SPFH domain-containing protein [Frankia sp. CNm7]|uniref:Band 7 domain-containing protein n=1 Tax=Frankia nepalensis TaxID=1836974 RepID=A0A937RP07_9ACTN|nr:SPFH domain-containing protein [Frankia nepalensis]MBL7498401.1 SPFH domain-containing protein [Frankia nepalensis]MBL7512051.1 SPFH domain-containing protein [Frankia nepalensis]MBL7524763.1 SPFH domain-containing protein [Frankia nepalensis]MBL7632380.1 hypothetical protein [Frankia nepalensis]
MPALFSAAIFFAVVAIGAAIARRVLGHAPGIVRRILLGVAIGTAVLAVVFTFFSSLVTVPTRQVGVVTAFNRPTGDVLSNGLHAKLPWQRVTDFDAAIQTDSYAPENTGANREGDCISVRIVNQATACVSVSARWRINPDFADELFRDYRTFDNVRASLVTRDLRAALNGALGDYDALGTVTTVSADGRETTPTAPTYDELSAEVTTALAERVGEPIEVLSVVISYIAYDQTTQDRINALQGEVAQTRIATQRQATAEAEAEANRILADSVSNDPNVLVAQCLTLLRAAVDKGQQLPAGFSCWPSGNAPFAVTQPQG